MIKKGAGFILVGLFVFGFWGSQQSIKAEEKIPQIYTCKQVTGKIKIDGILDEPDWQKAESIKFLHLPLTKDTQTQEYQEAISPAFGKILYDKNYLYIGLEAKDKDIWATMKDGEILCREDVLEIFIKPKKDSFVYYEFEISPKNKEWTLMWPRRGARSDKAAALYNPPLKKAVKIYGTLNDWRDVDDKWVLEVAIPFSAFKEVTSPPQAGDEWSFSFCRYDYSVYLEGGLEYSATAKLSKIWFHLYEDYDILKFGN